MDRGVRRERGGGLSVSAVASFPWYFFRPIAREYDVFWDHLRDAIAKRNVFDLDEIPTGLESAYDFRAHWANPDLFLSQCCGYHIATRVRNLKVVAAPVFTLTGVPPGMYRSVIVKRRGRPGRELADFRGMTIAYNEDQSYSGYTALLCAIPEPLLRTGFFGRNQRTESHFASIEAIIKGKADVAAIDEVSYQIITEHFPELGTETEVVKATESAMAPPYVTSHKRSQVQVDAMRDALVELSESPDEDLKKALACMRIGGFVDATNEDYLPMANQIQEVEAKAGNVWGNGQSESAGHARSA